MSENFVHLYVDFVADNPIPTDYKGHDIYDEIWGKLGHLSNTHDWVKLFQDVPNIFLEEDQLMVENIDLGDIQFFSTLASGDREFEEAMVDFLDAIVRDIENMIPHCNINLDIDTLEIVR